jgi:hypothetical protein
VDAVEEEEDEEMSDDENEQINNDGDAEEDSDTEMEDELAGKDFAREIDPKVIFRYKKTGKTC